MRSISNDIRAFGFWSTGVFSTVLFHYIVTAASFDESVSLYICMSTPTFSPRLPAYMSSAATHREQAAHAGHGRDAGQCKKASGPLRGARVTRGGLHFSQPVPTRRTKNATA